MIHPWLRNYPISKDSKRLIIGTHPPMPYNGNLLFFYGNRGEFWRLLSEVYPQEQLYINGVLNLDLILNFLSKYKFSITDMAYKTDGSSFSTDNKMKVIGLNPFLIEWLENSNVEEIYFTSFSGKNSALSLFKKWMRESDLRTRISNVYEWMDKGIEIELFGRKIKLYVLYSPSPTARRGIPRSIHYRNWGLNIKNPSPDDFRIWWYKRFFPPQFKY